MTPAEAQVLLSMAAAFDNRKPDPDAAKAWAAVLDGLRFDDCRQAVIEHYKAGTEWLMPATVRAIVKRIRRDRVLAFGTLPDPPPSIDGDQTAYTAWLAATTKRIADGSLKPDDIPALAPSGPPRDVLRELGHIGRRITTTEPPTGGSSLSGREA